MLFKRARVVRASSELQFKTSANAFAAWRTSLQRTSPTGFSAIQPFWRWPDRSARPLAPRRASKSIGVAGRGLIGEGSRFALVTQRSISSFGGLLAVSLFFIVTLFCPAALAKEVKYECSKSESFYRELEAAGVRVWGRNATLPKEPAWEALLPIYRKMRDYDISAAGGENCQASLRTLRKELIRRIVKYAPFLKVTIVDPSQRFNGLPSVTVDGAKLEKPEKVPLVQLRNTSQQTYEQIPGHPLLPGKHRIHLSTPRLDPNERLIVQAVLNGVYIGEGQSLDLDIDIPRGGPKQVHHLELKLQLVRECRVSLKLSGGLLESTAPRFVVRLQHRERLSNKTITFPGLYDAYAGENLLVAELLEGALPKDTVPLLLIDDAQAGMRWVHDAARPTWEYPLSLECPPGSSTGESSIELILSGSGSGSGAGRPPGAKKGRQGRSSFSPVFWTGVGVAAAGFGSATISYFGFQRPANVKANAKFRELGCPACDDAARAEVLRAWDKSDAAVPYTTAGIIVGGAGAALAVGALIWTAVTKDKPSEAALWVSPAAGPNGYGLHVEGRF